jgi:mannose-1-phosphate guanylyltransferase
MGVSVLDFWTHRLHSMGFEAVALNAHHLASHVREAIHGVRQPLPIHLFEEEILLGTGGGIRNALELFEGEDFVVVNGDTLCDAPLGELLVEHRHGGEPVTLVLHDCPPFNNVAVRGRDRIVAFGAEARELARVRRDIRLLAFTGIHCLSPGLLEPMKRGVPVDILTVYRNLIERGHPLKGLVLDGLLWREMGSLDAYRALHAECARWPRGILEPLVTGQPHRVHPTCDLAPDVTLAGYVAAGSRCRLHRGVVLESTILWDDVEIGEGSVLKDCIVTDGVSIRGSFSGRVFTETEP